MAASSSAAVPKQVKAFLENAENKDHFEIKLKEEGFVKIHCKLTGQELPPRVADLEAYTTTKKFLQMKKNKGVNKAQLELDVDYSVYEPHVIAHKRNKHLLFCQLTTDMLNKNKAQVEAHVNGKRYKKALKEFEELVKEDDDLESEEELEYKSDEEDAEVEAALKEDGDTKMKEKVERAAKRRKGEKANMEGDAILLDVPKNMTKLVSKEDKEKVGAVGVGEMLKKEKHAKKKDGAAAAEKKSSGVEEKKSNDDSEEKMCDAKAAKAKEMTAEERAEMLRKLSMSEALKIGGGGKKLKTVKKGSDKADKADKAAKADKADKVKGGEKKLEKKLEETPVNKFLHGSKFGKDAKIVSPSIAVEKKAKTEAKKVEKAGKGKKSSLNDKLKQAGQVKKSA